MKTALDEIIEAGIESLPRIAESKALERKALLELKELREKAWKYEELSR